MKAHAPEIIRCSKKTAAIISNVFGIVVLYVVYVITASEISHGVKWISITVISIIYIGLCLVLYLGAGKEWRERNPESSFTRAETITFLQSFFYISLGVLIGLGMLP